MKKLFYLPILALFILAGCSDVEENNIGASKKWIQFEQSAYQSPENAGTLRVPVLFASDSNPDGVSVNFTVTSTATNFAVAPSNGVLTIPAGELVGYIDVTPSYDPDNEITESYSVTITLQDGNFGVGVAGEGVFNKETVVTFNPSACPLVVADFIGTYTAAEVGYPTAYTVTASNPTANTMVISNVWDVSGSSTVTFDVSDPGSPKLFFQDNEFLYNDSTNGPIHIFNTTAAGQDDISTFDTCTKQITLFFSCGLPGGGAFFNTPAGAGLDPYVQKVVLTKN